MKNSKQITLWLVENGFKLNKEGVELLAEAVLFLHENINPNATKIYAAVGKLHNKTVNNVERCIRHTVETDWYKTTFKKYAVRPKTYETIKLLELIYEWDD